MLPASCSSCSPYLLIVFTRAAEDEQQQQQLQKDKRQHNSNRLRLKPILLHFASYHPPISQMEEETGRDPSCKPKSSSFTTPTLLPPNINHHNAHNRRLGLGPRDPGLFPDWWYYYYYYYYYHHHHHHHHRLNPYPPSILPLPPPPPPPPLPRHLLHPPPPPLLRRSQPPLSPRTVASSSDVRDVTAPPPSGFRELRATSAVRNNGKVLPFAPEESLAVARRPDDGGREGCVVPLLANHFLVKFDPDHRIYHYNVDITPSPSREVARMIKRVLVREKSSALSGSLPAFDGRSNLYSPVEFQKDRLDFFVSLPMPAFGSAPQIEELDEMDEPNKREKHKLFRINMKLVSELDGKGLSGYLSRDEDEPVPLPQDYLQALDIVLRDSASEKCITVGRSMYSSSMCGRKDIGGGAIGLRGFFQSLRPTQQGLALNIDFSVTAFHESIGVIPYLEKRLEFLRDLSKKKSRSLSAEERWEVEKALKNIRVFVCHRETVQRYRVYSLTKDSTEDLWFVDRDGKNLKLLNYFEDHYGYKIQYRNLPCLQASRGKACYLPMELCMICEGQKFFGKLSDDQTVRILRMGCQRPKERKAIIEGVMHGRLGPTSENQDKKFKLNVSREMTRVNGRILQPPKLKLGDRGQVRDLVPSRQDRQWNLLDSHVVEGIHIEKWTMISFGGTPEQKLMIPNFVTQLSHRCERLGIHLARTPSISPMFESNQLLNNVALLESKLQNIYKAASNGLQLLLCVMERKHRGYADLKRIAETTIGIVTQCCLYSNLGKPNSQFLANLSLKINAKVGGCTVALYNSLPGQIPRLLRCNEPVMFMGADVTHPHPLDDSSPSIAAVVGSVNWPAANKYVSRMRSQTHRQEIIEDLCEMVRELFEDFRQEVGELPKRIIFFRDGVSETQFRKVLKEEVRSLREACSKYSDYNPPITFAVVQKRHHTRLFPDGSDLPIFDENIPPGTVVDTVITHPREFDFYLCSHWGVKGTSRPTHYHVLLDESGFTSDELQKLVYNLCYTFVRCTKPISLVPPVYYAHLAAYRGRLYLERSENMGSTRNGGSQISRSGPPKARPLPKLSDNLKKLMFYC